MQVGGGVFSLKYTKHTGVYHRVGIDDITELKHNLDSVSTFITTNFDPNLTLWDHSIVPCQSVCATCECTMMYYGRVYMFISTCHSDQVTE